MSLLTILRGIRDQRERVLVVGLGISGIETAKCLLRLGITPVCVEKQSEVDFHKRSKLSSEIEFLRASGATVGFGVDGEVVVPYLEMVKLCVLSPGVPLEGSVVGAIERNKIPITSEFELGIELHGGQSIVVTGSNGKSTTVTLISEMLKSSGISAFLCGNVGTPIVASEEIRDLDDSQRETSATILVVEASSYQLESVRSLKPRVAVFLNLTDNHLERHGSLERYSEAKQQIFKLQDEGDLAIFNAEDPNVLLASQRVRSNRAFVGTRDESFLVKLAPYVAVINYCGAKKHNSISVIQNGVREEYDTADTALLGLHNQTNIGAAILAARTLGATPSGIATAIRNFVPLEHRVEKIFDRDGMVVINDSKSTTVAASIAAFNTVREVAPESIITLMLGGLSKAGSWEPLLNVLDENKKFVRPVICFGKDGRLLASHCRARGIDHQVAETLRDGTVLAINSARSGGVVLLSPGCASFDQFLDFEHRGREFKQYVQEIVA